MESVMDALSERWGKLRLTHLAETLLAKEGGSVFTMSYFGGEKVVPHYGSWAR
jgi:enoyl-[acyl-carrier-protein] reductase (NADH)